MSLKHTNHNQIATQAKSSVKIQIVFLLNSFGVGGIERQLAAQLQHYNQEKYSFHLITLYNYPDRQTLYNQLPEGVQIHKFNGTYGKANLRELWRVATLLKRLQPSLVVSSMFGPNTFNRLVSLWLGYVPLPREHNTYKDRGLIQRVIEHIGSYISPTTVAVSNEVATFTAKQSWVSKHKYTIIQNGVDLEHISKAQSQLALAVAQLKTEFQIPVEGRVWLNVARLKPQKNHDLLIEAFAEHTKSYPLDRLFILGGGHEEHRLREKIGVLGLSDQIILTGYRADVFAFYELADYFILTSDIEGFPNVVLEAMAFGVPVLSTAVAGIDEIIREGENGFMLERTVSSVRDTMGRVRSLSPEADAKLRTTAKHSVQHFSIERTVERYEKLFESMLKT